MNYRLLKHGSAVLAAGGVITGAVGGFLSAPIVILVGALTAAFAGLGRYILGEAEERKRKKETAESVGTIAMPAPTDETEAHGEIDEAVQHISAGRPDLTIELLEKIKKRRWDRLGDRERYRIIANLGTAKLAQQKTGEAAREYIRAVEYQPQDEDARAYEALGHFFLGDHEKARELALKICNDHPGLGRAQMVHIRTEPEQMPLDALVESVPAVVRTHPEVALALHERAASQNRATARRASSATRRSF